MRNNGLIFGVSGAKKYKKKAEEALKETRVASQRAFAELYLTLPQMPAPPPVPPVLPVPPVPPRAPYSDLQTCSWQDIYSCQDCLRKEEEIQLLRERCDKLEEELSALRKEQSERGMFSTFLFLFLYIICLMPSITFLLLSIFTLLSILYGCGQSCLQTAA